MSFMTEAKEIELISHLEEIQKGEAALIRDYLSAFKNDMTSAELIGAYRKLTDTGEATKAEECAFLDLVNPFAVQ